MTKEILIAFYFTLPAYIGNTFPILIGQVLKLPGGRPINTKIFGAHKTWRGFYTAYLGALFTLITQFYFQSIPFFAEISLLDYQQINLFFYAFLFGVGAMTGDLIKSFFKRRIGIKSGDPWFPFDQLDLIIGALLFLAPFYLLPGKYILILVIITPLLHFLTNLTAYFLKIKKVWW